MVITLVVPTGFMIVTWVWCMPCIVLMGLVFQAYCSLHTVLTGSTLVFLLIIDNDKPNNYSSKMAT